jgi:aspartokinase-like uncharacterized kinase
MTRALAVKFGGSLMDIAADVLCDLKASGRPILIIPGGGMFADTVRNSGAGDETAHWMAVLGMEQYGWYLSGFDVPAADTPILPEKGVLIFLPYRLLREADPLPHFWDVTSDSVAAWIAGKCRTDLLLLKSVDGTGPDAVDPFCRTVLNENGTHAAVINVRRKDRLSSFLRGEEVPHVRIS